MYVLFVSMFFLLLIFGGFRILIFYCKEGSNVFYLGLVLGCCLMMVLLLLFVDKYYSIVCLWFFFWMMCLVQIKFLLQVFVLKFQMVLDVQFRVLLRLMVFLVLLRCRYLVLMELVFFWLILLVCCIGFLKVRLGRDGFWLIVGMV